MSANPNQSVPSADQPRRNEYEVMAAQILADAHGEWVVKFGPLPKPDLARDWIITEHFAKYLKFRFRAGLLIAAIGFFVGITISYLV